MENTKSIKNATQRPPLGFVSTILLLPSKRIYWRAYDEFWGLDVGLSMPLGIRLKAHNPLNPIGLFVLAKGVAREVGRQSNQGLLPSSGPHRNVDREAGEKESPVG